MLPWRRPCRGDTVRGGANQVLEGTAAHGTRTWGPWVVALLLAACGAGGDDGQVDEEPPADLSGYLGTWQGPCADRAAPTLSFAPSGRPGVLSVVEGVDHYDQAGCGGAVVASLVYGPASQAAYLETVEGQVRGPRPGVTVPVPLDVFEIARPERTATMAGPTVREQTDVGGTRYWCFDDAAGTTCVAQPVPEPAAQSMVRYLTGPAQLYLPVLNQAVYDLPAPYIKRGG